MITIKSPLYFVLTLLLSTLTAGCQPPSDPGDEKTNGQSLIEISPEETARANTLFEQVFQANLARSPVSQTQLGIKDNYGKWDDLSEQHAQEGLGLTKQHLTNLEQIDRSILDQDAQISYDLMQQQLINALSDFKWRFHNYPVNQMFGTHAMVPALLINQHTVASLDDAQAYLSRLDAVPELFSQLRENLAKRAGMGIIAPRFVFPLVIESSGNVISGAPFDKGEDSAILADFKRKVAALELSEDIAAVLIQDAEASLLSAVKPAYVDLISYLKELEQKADDIAGAWHLPDGEAFYNVMLKRTTTTDLTANEIHNLGLQEVERIHNEMRKIKDAVGFSGDLKAFMQSVKNGEQFLYADTQEGKAQYLAEATALIDTMKSKLDTMFGLQPKAELIVKAVEPFREKAGRQRMGLAPVPTMPISTI